MSRDRIIFVNRFYWPETPATGQLLADLATALAAEGRCVVVVTSGPKSLPRRESNGGVDIHRVRSPRWAHGSVVGKGVAFGTFFLGAVIRLLRLAGRGDTIVVMTDPPLLGLAAAPIAKLSGARLIHWLQDIYPEIAITLTGHRWLGALNPFRNLAWRSAAATVVVGNDMLAFVRATERSTLLSVPIPNWPPAGLAPLGFGDPSVIDVARAWGVEGKFVVGYSGNLGRVHDLDVVLAAAAALREDDRIVFVFIGGGAQRERLDVEARRLGLSNVRFVPAQPRERLAAALAVAHVHLVTLKPGCESFVFPSKLYGVAAAGRPVLFVGPPTCEVARLVRSARMGRVADSRQPSEVIAAVREFVDRPGACADAAAAALGFAREHDFARALAQWRQVLSAPPLPAARAVATPVSTR